MSLSASARGVVLVLLSASVVQGQDGWGVTYTSLQICAIEGSTVNMSCSFTYGSTVKGPRITVWGNFWIKGDKPHDLRVTYPGRVEYHCSNSDCTLRIRDVRKSDSAEYKFRFSTRNPDKSLTGSPGVTLSIADLRVQVSRLYVSDTSNQARLKCHSSCRLPDHLHYVWFKNGQKIEGESSPAYEDDYLPEDNFSCALEGYERSISSPLSVYAPTLPSVSVSPSAEIVEGTSVNLICSSDANPAANYTWYKEDGDPDLQPLSEEPQLVFRSIRSSDSGEFYCTVQTEREGRKSKHVFIDVKYAPNLPSVSASPSAEIVEGTSVTLTCSSDANPEANYTWYKEDEDSPKASGQNFNISDVRAEHSGNYYCEAQNRIGLNNSTVHLTVVAGSETLKVAGIITGAVLLAIVSLSVFLWIRRKTAGERPDNRDEGQPGVQDELQYASIHFSNNQAGQLYSNITPAGPLRPVEQQEEVEYAPVRCSRASAAPRTSRQETGEDSAVLYSTVTKAR